jgi:hypothetical protein
MVYISWYIPYGIYHLVYGTYIMVYTLWYIPIASWYVPSKSCIYHEATFQMLKYRLQFVLTRMSAGVTVTVTVTMLWSLRVSWLFAAPPGSPGCSGPPGLARAHCATGSSLLSSPIESGPAVTRHPSPVSAPGPGRTSGSCGNRDGDRDGPSSDRHGDGHDG